MPENLSPGLYYENVDASPPTISALRTDADGFVGISARLVGDGSPIDPWRQFQAYFGGLIGAGYLAYAIRAVLENGGRCCPRVGVTSKDEFLGASMANTIFNSAGQPGRKIEASSPGLWRNQSSSSNDRDAPGSDNRVISGNGSGFSANRVNYRI